LSLAVLGFITLPSRLIESTIAASVVIVALNNLYPLIEKRLWIVTFVFGMVHGLGFANVLTDLALPKRELAVSLISFNLGVEAGQLAIMAMLFALGLSVSSLAALSAARPRGGLREHRGGRVAMAGRARSQYQHIALRAAPPDRRSGRSASDAVG
jgi:hypothetical protein